MSVRRDPGGIGPPIERDVDVGGARLRCVEQGRGTPIVFVHGAGGDWRTWEPLRPYVAASRRFVTYSRRYHWPNASDGDDRPYTVPDQADDLVALVEALGAGPVHVVGGSYGARVVLEAATRRPDLFLTVAASEAFITPPVDPVAGVAARALAVALARIGEAMRTGDTDGATRALADAVTGEADVWQRLPEDVRRRFLDNRDSWIAIARSAQPPATSCEALGRLPMPVLVLEGERTVAGFRVTNDRLMECLPPGASRYVVPGAPHMWYPVNPSDAARRILSFVESSEARR